MAYKITGTTTETTRILVIKESDWSVESNTVVSGSGAFEITAVSGSKVITGITNDDKSLSWSGVEAELVTPPPAFHDEMTDDTWWTEGGVGEFTPAGYVKSVSTESASISLQGYPNKWKIGAGDWEVIVDFDIDSITGSPTSSFPYQFDIYDPIGGKGGALDNISVRGNGDGTLSYRVYGNGLDDDGVGSITTGNFKFRIKNVSGTTTVWIWSGSQWEWDGNTAGITSTATGEFTGDAAISFYMLDLDLSHWFAMTINSVTLVTGTFVDLT